MAVDPPPPPREGVLSASLQCLNRSTGAKNRTSRLAPRETCQSPPEPLRVSLPIQIGVQFLRLPRTAGYIRYGSLSRSDPAPIGEVEGAVGVPTSGRAPLANVKGTPSDRTHFGYKLLSNVSIDFLCFAIIYRHPPSKSICRLYLGALPPWFPTTF